MPVQNISVITSTHPQHKDITLLSVKGFIDTTTAPEFDKAFQAAMGQKKYNLIVDLKDVNYISSAGWGLFVGEIKRIRSQRGNLFLVAMCPEVVEAYELLQFESILKSFPSVEQAIQKGFGKSQAKKGSPNPKLEKNPEITPAAKDLQESPVGVDFKKPHWFARILLPWKWF
jgi:anti-sigma B factor antagonist